MTLDDVKLAAAAPGDPASEDAASEAQPPRDDRSPTPPISFATVPPATRRFWIGLGAISVVALVWRVSYVIHEIGRIPLNGDAAYYHWQANLVAKGFGFIDPTRYELFGMKTPSAGTRRCTSSISPRCPGSSAPAS